MTSSRITRAASLKATAEVSNEGAEVALGARVGVCDGAVEGALLLGALLRVVVGATVVGGAVRGLAVGVVVGAIAGKGALVTTIASVGVGKREGSMWIEKGG